MVTLFLVSNSLTTREVCAGAFSWCNNQQHVYIYIYPAIVADKDLFRSAARASKNYVVGSLNPYPANVENMVSS